MKMYKKIRTLTLLFIAASTIAVSMQSTSPSAFAAEPQQANGTGNETILLSPTSKRYDIDASSSAKDTIKVVNDGQTDFTFVVYARPYSVSDEQYSPDFVSKSQNGDAYKWIQFDQPSYTIKAGQSIDVGYTIRVPAGAAPGGHYGVLFAETQANPTQVSGNAILRKKRVGSILYVTVKGDIKQSGVYKNADVPVLQMTAPLKIRQRIANEGNTDFSVSSGVSVSDVFGNLKYKMQKDIPILPGTTRELNNDWNEPAWIGIYKVTQTAKFLDSNVSRSSYVLLIPLWVYLLFGGLIVGRILHAVIRRNKK